MNGECVRGNTRWYVSRKRDAGRSVNKRTILVVSNDYIALVNDDHSQGNHVVMKTSKYIIEIIDINFVNILIVFIFFKYLYSNHNSARSNASKISSSVLPARIAYSIIAY